MPRHSPRMGEMPGTYLSPMGRNILFSQKGEKQFMKKNTMMRIASFLLIAVLLSTSAISGTYAKYVTKDEAVDHARVAKWGVTVEATDDSMFNGYYETHDTERKAVIGAISVLSAGTDNVVAPGTDGKLADFVIKGTPEVAVRINYEVTNLELAGWALADATPYCPIIFTINGTDYYIGDSESVDDFEIRVKTTG